MRKGKSKDSGEKERARTAERGKETFFLLFSRSLEYPTNKRTEDIGTQKRKKAKERV